MQTALIIACCVLFCACAALLGVCLYQKAETKKLSDSIVRYLENGQLTDFSTKEYGLATLQNNIADLQALAERRRSNAENESKRNTEFISDISHQLKTPLAGLRLYCEMDEAESPTPHTKKELQLIEKMESLIYRLLRLEKLRADAYVLDFQVHELGGIVNEVLSALRPIFPEKQFCVTGSAKLRCDKAWLSEAISNVLKNAAEHTPPAGRVCVTIEGGEKSTVLSVTDNGGGVPPEELGKLFTRFHKTANALPNSAGIGLAITKAIVEKHHGTVTAENRDGGLCITMCFIHIDGRISL